MKTMRIPTMGHHQPARFPKMFANKVHCGGSLLTTDPAYFPIDSNAVHSVPATVLQKSYLDYYRLKLNQIRAQQCAAVASLANPAPNVREHMVKSQLMKAVLARPRPDYLDYLRKYASDQSSGVVRREFDYLDYIRRDSAEEFRRNGVEVSGFANCDTKNGNGSISTSTTAYSSGSVTQNGRDQYKAKESMLRSSPLIWERGDETAVMENHEFTTTSMSNHEPLDMEYDGYRNSHSKPDDFHIPRNISNNNKRNIFKTSSSRHQSGSGGKRHEIVEKPVGKIKYVQSVQYRRPKRARQYKDFSPQSERDAIMGNGSVQGDFYIKRRPLGSSGSTPERNSPIVNSPDCEDQVIDTRTLIR